ncbi:MAG: hypothetical protein ACK58L_12680 [Planctomycetota bacterium]
MSVVAHSIQILNGPVTVCRFVIAFLAAVTLCGRPGLAQNAQTPTEATTPATADEATPTPAANDGTTAPATPPNSAAVPVQEGCAQEIEKQQALVRSLMNLQKPIGYPDKAAAEKLRREVGNLIKTGFKGEDTKKVVSYLEYQMLRSTDPSFATVPSNMQDLQGDVIDTIGLAGNLIGNPQEQLVARRAYCGEILKIAKQMLDNNFDARMSAVIIISNLHDVKAVPGGAKAKVYEPAISTLVEVLGSKEQPDALKATVAGQLAFLLKTCDVNPQDQFRICDTIAAEMKRDCTEAGYQLNLLDAALEISQPRKKIGVPEPTAMAVFAAALNSPNKPVEVRCRAAFGIGQGSHDAEMKLEPLAWKICQLAGEVAIQFNRDVKDPKWQHCGMNLFYSFWHINANQRQGTNARGLLNRDPKSKFIADAAPQIGTVSLFVLQGKSFKAADLQPLADLLNASRPANGTWDKNAPAIEVK